MHPAKQYILIRISREEQKAKKEKIGSLFIAPDELYMQYNMQCGEIVEIGEKAQREFPEAKVGHIAIIHHFVEGESEASSRDQYLVHQDDAYNYYVVTPCLVPGKNIDIYGVWDGEKIIPHKDYVLVEPDPKVKVPETPDEYIESALKKTDGGIYVFSDWKDTYEDKVDRQKRIKEEIQNLSINSDNPQVQVAIARKEEEMAVISQEINQKTYLPYIVCWAPYILTEWFDTVVTTGTQLFILNSSTDTHVDFMDKKYRVVLNKFIGAIKV